MFQVFSHEAYKYMAKQLISLRNVWKTYKMGEVNDDFNLA